MVKRKIIDGDTSQPTAQKSKKIRLTSNPVHTFYEWSKEDETSYCKCGDCKEGIKSKNTTNLENHLKRHHPEQFVQFQKLVADAVQQQEAKEKGKEEAQGITQFFKPTEKYAYNHPAQIKLDNILRDFLLGGTYPVSMVEDPGFRAYVSALNPRAGVPCRATMRKRINHVWPTIRSRIVEQVAKARCCHITTDIWSSQGCAASYLGMTVHFYDLEKNCLKSYAVSCEEFPSPHTGERIAQAIQNICENLSIWNKVSYIVADNGANMQCAIKMIRAEDQQQPELEDSEDEDEDDDEDGAEGERKPQIAREDMEEKEPELLPPLDASDIEELEKTAQDIQEHVTSMGKQSGKCFSHTMQLAVGKALNGKSSIFRVPLKKVRDLSRMFSRSGKAKDILKASGGLSIKSYCATRWFSELTTVKSFMQNRQLKGDPVATAAIQMGWKSSLPSVEDYRILQRYTEIMEPFARHTDELGGEKYCTINNLMPSLRDLLGHLTEVEQSDDTPGVKNFAGDLKAHIMSYFGFCLDKGHQFYNPIYVATTYLDPSRVEVDVLTGEEEVSAQEFLKEACLKLDVTEGHVVCKQSSTASNSSEADFKETEEPPVALHRTDSKWSRFKSLKAKVKGKEGLPPDNSFEARFKKDLLLMDEVFERESTERDPLKFWSGNKDMFQTALPLIAIDVLTVTATSTPSERLFSQSGLLSKDKFGRITPKNLELRVLGKINLRRI